jgi:hypothetical protein
VRLARLVGRQQEIHLFLPFGGSDEGEAGQFQYRVDDLLHGFQVKQNFSSRAE